MADDNNNSPFADDPVPDPDYVPAARTGLIATGQFSTILLKWDHPPNQADSVNLAYVEVYRSSTNVRPVLPDGLIWKRCSGSLSGNRQEITRSRRTFPG